MLIIPLSLSFFWAAPLVQDPEPEVQPEREAPASQDPELQARIDELAAARDALASAGSYRLEILTESSGGGFGGGRGGFGAGQGADDGGQTGPQEPQPVVVQWSKGTPMHLVQGENSGYKSGDVLVYQNDEGAWTRYEPRSMFRRRRGGEGGEGGEAGGRRGGGEGGVPDRAAWSRIRALGNLASARTPSEILADLEDKVEELERTQDGETRTYTGTLTPEGAEDVHNAGRARFGRGGGRGSMAFGGSFTVVVGAGGVVQSIETETSMSGSFGERSFERSRSMTVTVDGVGETAYEVPSEAVAAILAPDAGEEF